jgi:hypothetical protein
MLEEASGGSDRVTTLLDEASGQIRSALHHAGGGFGADPIGSPPSSTRLRGRSDRLLTVVDEASGQIRSALHRRRRGFGVDPIGSAL